MVEIAPLEAGRIIATLGGAVARGAPERNGSPVVVRSIAEPAEAGPDSLTFLIAEGFLADVLKTKASVVVVQEALIAKVASALPETVACVVSVKDAYLGLAQISRVIAESDPYFDWRAPVEPMRGPVHPGAHVDPTASVGIGAVVCEGAKIGARTVLLPNCVIGPHVAIGADCTIFPGVIIYPRTTIGDRVRIHGNCVVGSDGFGYARGPQGSVKIWHLGRVLIEDDVELGSGTTIDKGTIKDTRIERGAKLDNMVQVGHNGHVKQHAILCAQVGLAGNVTVGRGAILAGKAGVADKITIADGSVVGPMAGLSKDTKPGEIMMAAIPAKPRREWWKLVALIDKLPELFDRVKKLEREDRS